MQEARMWSGYQKVTSINTTLSKYAINFTDVFIHECINTWDVPCIFDKPLYQQYTSAMNSTQYPYYINNIKTGIDIKR